MIPTRTLGVWCPDWAVAAAGVGADVRAAVFQANRVVACSAAARAEGVKRGLRRREAQARCPDLVVLERDPAQEGRAFEPVAAAVEAFAPRLEILRPGICIVPTRGPSRYFGGDEALAAKVRDAVVAATGHPCATGIADGPFAAVLAARRGVIVAPGEVAAFLSPFPVTVLERPDLADLLARLGIRTLGQFAALPAEDVLARFGLDGLAAHRLAGGLDERPLATRNPPPDLVVQMELDPPAQRVDTVAFAGKALADDLHERLARRGLACTRISIEAETEHGERLSRLWRHEGALTPGAIAERVRWQLDGWLAGTARAASSAAADECGAPVDPDPDIDAPEPTAGLILLRLVPDEVVPDDGRQVGFWGGAGEGGERAARALARVQGMLGPQAVVSPMVSGGREPVEQIALIPWGDVREPSRPPSSGRWSRRSAGSAASGAAGSGAAGSARSAGAGAAGSGAAGSGAARSAGSAGSGAARSGAARSAGSAGSAGSPGAGASASRAGARLAAVTRAAGKTARGLHAAAPAPAPARGLPAPAPTTPAPAAADSLNADPPYRRVSVQSSAGTAGKPVAQAKRRSVGRAKSSASESAAWPGELPSPSPATVYRRPRPAEVVDADGVRIYVTGRHAVNAPPARLSIDGGRWADITAWAGPWPVDERWWDPRAHRRRARFQVVTALGVAYLLAVEKGAWSVEAVYD